MIDDEEDYKRGKKKVIKAFHIGGSAYSHNGIIGCQHDYLTNEIAPIGSKKHNMSLKVQMKNPRMNMKVNDIKVNATMKDVKNPCITLDDDRINKKLTKFKRRKIAF